MEPVIYVSNSLVIVSESTYSKNWFY